jgi:long-chain acyl-CoA synthetase
VGNLEAKYAHAPIVGNVCVVADSHHNTPVALVAVNGAGLKQLAAATGMAEDAPANELCDEPAIVAAALVQLNGVAGKQKLEKWERLAAVKLYAAPWTSEDGLLTEALKIKRHEINKRFKDDIAALYR